MKNNLNKSLPLNPLKELSMGMSNDYEIAIEEGQLKSDSVRSCLAKKLT